MAESKPRIAAVLLAAGSSRRMGAPNKLHLPVAGQALLRRSLGGLLDSRVDQIVVVLGHEHEKTAALIKNLPLRTVVNDAYEKGQMTSVECGLDALGDGHDMVLIALGDQPALRGADIDRLIESFLDRDGGEVMVPTCHGERGNPVIISAAFRRAVLADRRGLGCRQLIDSNPALVRRVEMSNPAFVLDLDTPEQYADFVASEASGSKNTPNRQVG